MPLYCTEVGALVGKESRARARRRLHLREIRQGYRGGRSPKALALVRGDNATTMTEIVLQWERISSYVLRPSFVSCREPISHSASERTKW